MSRSLPAKVAAAKHQPALISDEVEVVRRSRELIQAYRASDRSLSVFGMRSLSVIVSLVNKHFLHTYMRFESQNKTNDDNLWVLYVAVLFYGSFFISWFRCHSFINYSTQKLSFNLKNYLRQIQHRVKECLGISLPGPLSKQILAKRQLGLFYSGKLN